jgi:hypothetical protein
LLIVCEDASVKTGNLSEVCDVAKKNFCVNSEKVLVESQPARIFKLLRSPRIDSKKPIPPSGVAWRAGTTTLFLLGS